MCRANKLFTVLDEITGWVKKSVKCMTFSALFHWSCIFNRAAALSYTSILY